MSEKLYVGHHDAPAERWQVFNSDYGVNTSRRKLPLRFRWTDEPSKRPWVAKRDGRGGDNFATHAEALAYAMSEAAK